MLTANGLRLESQCLTESPLNTTLPRLGFLDDRSGEWVGGQWLDASTYAELEAEREYERVERTAIVEFGGGVIHEQTQPRPAEGSEVHPAVIEAAEAVVRPGQVYVVKIAHDSWCDLLNGGGQCNCNPEVSKPQPIHQPEDN